MKLLIKIPLEVEMEYVYEHFNRDLFEALSPPVGGMNLIHFGGSHPGHHVKLELNIFGIRMPWISRITDEFKGDSEIWFIDKGEKLPFFLQRWHHKHIIRKTSEGCLIIEDITYSSGSILLDYLIFPIMSLQFGYRKKAYPRYFNRLIPNK